MRSLLSIAGIGLLAVSGSAYGQALSEHAAAAAGATIGTAAGKPVANALGGIFNQVDATTATAAGAGARATNVVPVKVKPDPSASVNHGAAPGVFSPGFGDGGSQAAAVGSGAAAQTRSRRRSAPVAASEPAAYAALAPIAEPVKEPTLEELAAVKIGTSKNDLFSSLGRPESHISVPDDGGRLLESCQFWAGGKQLGTVRLENGQVVKVEVRAAQ